VSALPRTTAIISFPSLAPVLIVWHSLAFMLHLSTNACISHMQNADAAQYLLRCRFTILTSEAMCCVGLRLRRAKATRCVRGGTEGDAEDVEGAHGTDGPSDRA